MRKNKQIRLVKISSIRFSPEIEVEFPHSKDSQKLIDRHRVLQGWEIDSDGSLDNGAEYRPKRSNKLYWNEESLTQLKEMLAIIRAHRGKCSNTTGLHIHVDAKRFTDKQITTIIHEFVHKQRFIVKRFAVRKERLAEMCKLLPQENLQKITVKQINKFRGDKLDWNFRYYQYFEEKYHSLNITHLSKGDYGTLEFRLFNGTLNFRELKERIYWTLTFIKDCLERE
jgi:hypothetical protein